MTSHEKAVRRLARKLGLTLAISKKLVDYNYDGKGRITVPAGTQALSDACHEIGHFLVAPPARKWCINYGLGLGPSDSNLAGKRQISSQVAEEEEQLASILGILIERELGLDFRGTLEEHNWTGSFTLSSDNWKDIHRVMKALLEQGHIKYKQNRYCPVALIKE